MAEQLGNMVGLRDAAIVGVASDALLSVSEVAALDVSDINLAEQTVLIRHSKTDQRSKGTVQFLGKPTTERIQAWLLNSGLTEGESDGQEHPDNYHTAGQGRLGGRPG